jgi:hypothetical protein
VTRNCCRGVSDVPWQPTVLGADDFATLEVLKLKPCHAMIGRAEPKHLNPFVGEGWLQDTFDVMKHLVDAADEVSGPRVSPGVLVGSSRSGKTRALIELFGKFREKELNVIFVSFNDSTTYGPDEKSSASVLESLLARIAFAIAKPAAINGRTLHDDDADKRRLRFSTTKAAVLTWLADNNVVLLIDELNQAVDPNERDQSTPVAEFLRDHFVSKTGRYYAFTSHVASAVFIVDLIGGAAPSAWAAYIRSG